MVSNQYEDTKVYCSGSAYNECGSDYVFDISKSRFVIPHLNIKKSSNSVQVERYCFVWQYKRHMWFFRIPIKLTRQTFKDIVLNNFNNHLRCLVIFYVKKICVNLLPLLVKMNQLIISREPSVWQLFFTYILGKIGRYR